MHICYVRVPRDKKLRKAQLGPLLKVLQDFSQGVYWTALSSGGQTELVLTFKFIQIGGRFQFLWSVGLGTQLLAGLLVLGSSRPPTPPCYRDLSQGLS